MSIYYGGDQKNRMNKMLETFPTKLVPAFARVPDLSSTIYQVGNVLYYRNKLNEGGLYLYIAEINHEVSGVALNDNEEGIVFEGDVYNTTLKTIVQYGSIRDEPYDPCDFIGFGERLTCDKERERQDAARAFDRLTRNWTAFPTAPGIMMIPGRAISYSLADLLRTEFSADSIKESFELVEYEWEQLIKYEMYPIVSDGVAEYWSNFVDRRIRNVEMGVPQEEWSTPDFLNYVEERLKKIRKDEDVSCHEMVIEGSDAKYTIRTPYGQSATSGNQEIKVYRSSP